MSCATIHKRARQMNRQSLHLVNFYLVTSILINSTFNLQRGSVLSTEDHKVHMHTPTHPKSKQMSCLMIKDSNVNLSEFAYCNRFTLLYPSVCIHRHTFTGYNGSSNNQPEPVVTLVTLSYNVISVQNNEIRMI